MSRSEGAAPPGGSTAGSAPQFFQREWQAYRKIVDNNYLFHREVYERLRAILLEISHPFQFLDIACGDAGSTIGALEGSAVAGYYGIDLSEPALDIARNGLAHLGCSVDLRHADFATALKDWSEPVDVAWIGLSLHHFQAPEKLDLMRQIRRIVGPKGLLVIYENTSLDGEARQEWMDRWDLQRPGWTACSEEEWNMATSHVHGNDFPETRTRWLELGRDAGFGTVDEIFVAPTDLFRMYSFRA
jgi:SAM-dependent methyltransferase